MACHIEAKAYKKYRFGEKSVIFKFCHKCPLVSDMSFWCQNTPYDPLMTIEGQKYHFSKVTYFVTRCHILSKVS